VNPCDQQRLEAFLAGFVPRSCSGLWGRLLIQEMA